MVATISHIAFVVRDPARTAAIFENLFGVSAIPPSPDHKGPAETTFQLGGISFVLVKGDPISNRTDDHVAFTVPQGELLGFQEKLRTIGLESQMARGGTALYFVDFDNHLFELNAAQS